MSDKGVQQATFERSRSLIWLRDKKEIAIYRRQKRVRISSILRARTMALHVWNRHSWMDLYVRLPKHFSDRSRANFSASPIVPRIFRQIKVAPEHFTAAVDVVEKKNHVAHQREVAIIEVAPLQKPLWITSLVILSLRKTIIYFGLSKDSALFGHCREIRRFSS